MSAEIYINKDGKASMLSGNNVTPWHGLGKVIKGLATAEQVIKHAGLDFKVEKVPEIVKLPLGKDGRRVEKEVPNRFAVVRTDTYDILGSVGSAWTPLQNEEAFNFFDPIIDRSEAIYETAGVLGKGERTWIMAKLPNHIRVGKDDVIQPYVTIFNQHKKGAVICMFNLTRIVCNNTMQAALSEGLSRVHLIHSPNIAEKIKDVHEVMGIANLYQKEMEEIFQQMSKTRITDKGVKNLLEEFIPRKSDVSYKTQGDKYKEEILEVIHSGVGQEFDTCKGTVYGVYNGITHWLDHNKEYSDANAKLNSIWFGTSSKKRQKAFDLCNKLITN